MVKVPDFALLFSFLFKYPDFFLFFFLRVGVFFFYYYYFSLSCLYRGNPVVRYKEEIILGTGGEVSCGTKAKYREVQLCGTLRYKCMASWNTEATYRGIQR